MFKYLKHLICFLILFNPVFVIAQISSVAPTDTGPGQVGTMMMALLFWLLSGAAVLTLLFMPISGVMYLAAGGDEDRVTKARVVFFSSLAFFILSVIGLIILNSVQGAVGA